MDRKKPDAISGVSTIRIAAAATVVGLAGIAGAISYSHMQHLAEVHGEQGWRAHCFPLSVGGIEIVASLVLLYHRRAGSPAGGLPWVALAAGTLASLAANVAVGATDLVGRAVAGWPAIALLVAVKLLSGLLGAGGTHGAPRANRFTARTGRSAHTSSGRATRRRTTSPGRSANVRTNRADLEQAARVAAADLAAAGQRLSRENLARTLRTGGHSVSNASAGDLLALVRSQSHPGPASEDSTN
jgi:hypothetical protein